MRSPPVHDPACKPAPNYMYYLNIILKVGVYVVIWYDRTEDSHILLFKIDSMSDFRLTFRLKAGIWPTDETGFGANLVVWRYTTLNLSACATVLATVLGSRYCVWTIEALTTLAPQPPASGMRALPSAKGKLKMKLYFPTFSIPHSLINIHYLHYIKMPLKSPSIVLSDSLYRTVYPVVWYTFTFRICFNPKI